VYNVAHRRGSPCESASFFQREDGILPYGVFEYDVAIAGGFTFRHVPSKQKTTQKFRVVYVYLLSKIELGKLECGFSNVRNMYVDISGDVDNTLNHQAVFKSKAYGSVGFCVNFALF
jgi:hypothetical protein